MQNDPLFSSELFSGVGKEEVESILSSSVVRTAEYGKNSLILRAGDRADNLCLIVKGSVNIVLEDWWGNRSVLQHIEAGGIFAETYAAVPDIPMLVSAEAQEQTVIIFIPIAYLAQRSARMLGNLLALMARKNIELSRRALHTAPKTIREKLVSYLSAIDTQEGHHGIVELPFTRQTLANYLNVERSALSHELKNMERDGLVKVDKRKITLLK